MTRDEFISVTIMEALQSAPAYILSDAESDLRMAALQESCIKENTTLIDAIVNSIVING